MFGPSWGQNSHERAKIVTYPPDSCNDPSGSEPLIRPTMARTCSREPAHFGLNLARFESHFGSHFGSHVGAHFGSNLAHFGSHFGSNLLASPPRNHSSRCCHVTDAERETRFFRRGYSSSSLTSNLLNSDQLQGYLAHKKLPPARILPYSYA